MGDYEVVSRAVGTILVIGLLFLGCAWLMMVLGRQAYAESPAPSQPFNVYQSGQHCVFVVGAPGQGIAIAAVPANGPCK